MSSEPAGVEPNLITVAAIKQIKDAKTWMQTEASAFSHVLLRRHAEELRKLAREAPQPRESRILFGMVLGVILWLAVITVYTVNGFQAFDAALSALAHEERMK